MNYTDGTRLTISHWNDECVSVNYSTKSYKDSLVASFNISNVHLYGGPITGIGANQDLNWPSEKIGFMDDPYMCIDCETAHRYKNKEYYSAILEPYWLFSNGYYIYVDNNVPLFITSNETNLNLTAKITGPYQQLPEIALNFVLCKLDDAVEAHKHAIKQFLGKPSKLPDVRGVRQPVWSTCDVTQVKEQVNQITIMDFVNNITASGYGGRIVIRHKWEDYWGSLQPDKSKFSNFSGLLSYTENRNLTLAFRVHPYVSKLVELSDKQREYLVKSNCPDQFHWDLDRGHYIDSTNPEALSWLGERLRNFSKTYRTDSFEFDNGDYTGLTFNESITNPVETIIQENTKMLANLSSNIVSYVARGTQKYGFFIPMHLTSRKPTPSYALRAIISHLLQMNILGYSFVLPSIIENDVEYHGEMFLRWVQLCVFMPSMQFSISQSPWLYDEEVFIC